ncbi:MAG TPA: oligosaccharide flippase family protein [Bacteroidota bacterium]|nr:oligosaccharide flippase family protein [Bacteroidota bacterium]
MLKAVKSLVSASFVYGLGTIGSKFIGFFLLPVFTRYLTPSEYGLFETFNVFCFLLSSIGTLAMDTALIRFYYDSTDPQHRSLVVSSALFLTTSAGVILALLGFAFSSQINGALFGSADHVSILHITMFIVVVSIINTIQLALFQAKRNPGRYSILTFFRFTAMYSLSIYFLIKGESVYGLMLAQVIAYGATVLWGFLFSRHDFRLAVSRKLSKEMLIFSAPLIVGSISIWLLSSSDRFFLLHFSSLNELGLYSLGSRLASVVLFAVTAFQMAWPQFALARPTDENTGYTHARILTYYLFIGTLIVLGITLFTPEILRILTTSSYAGAASVVFLLSCSSLFFGCYFVFGIILSLTKNTVSILPVALPPLLVNVLLNYYLVPRMGGMGSAIASASAYLLMAVLTFVFTNRFFPIRYEWGRIAKMMLIAGCVILIGRMLSWDSLLLSIAAKSSLLAIYFLALSTVKFFLPIEMQTIKNILLRPFHLTSQ